MVWLLTPTASANCRRDMPCSARKMEIRLYKLMQMMCIITNHCDCTTYAWVKSTHGRCNPKHANWMESGGELEARVSFTVRQLHRDLLKYSTKDERHRGEYKTLPNDVAAFDADGKASASCLRPPRHSALPARWRSLSRGLPKRSATKPCTR